MGYAGGSSPDPTYHNLDGHFETVQMDFDPERISYAKLLDLFWNSHDPGQKPWSRQYASIIFFHDDEQKNLAEESKSRQEEALGKVKLYTDILPYDHFYLAEDYHQKYWLQGSSKLINEFRGFYPDFKGIISSTAAARVNGIIGGYGRLNGTVKELSSYGLSTESNKLLMTLLNRSARQPVS